MACLKDVRTPRVLGQFGVAAPKVCQRLALGGLSGFYLADENGMVARRGTFLNDTLYVSNHVLKHRRSRRAPLVSDSFESITISRSKSAGNELLLLGEDVDGKMRPWGQVLMERRIPLYAD